MAFGIASVPDLLRLVFLPAFAWAAYRDVRTRRLPNLLWPPLAGVALLALAWDAVVRFPFAGADDRLFLVRVGFAVAFLLPFSYLAYLLRAFGGADAKAMMVLALAFPTTPAYTVPAGVVPSSQTAAVLPLHPSLLGVTAMAVLTNAVLVASAYVAGLGAWNLLRGRVSLAMFLGRPLSVDALPDAHGTLLRTDGLPSTGLDLDALRMYLRWRGLSLADLRADPERLRDPASVTTTHDPTDGAVHRDTDDGAGDRKSPSNGAIDGESDDRWRDTGFVGATPQPDGIDRETDGDETTSDPWGAEAFLDDVAGSAYGTTPADLRKGLDRITTADVVWVSPGLPFVVPLFGGLVVAVTYGDVLTVLLRAVGLF